MKHCCRLDRDEKMYRVGHAHYLHGKQTTMSHKEERSGVLLLYSIILGTLSLKMTEGTKLRMMQILALSKLAAFESFH
jgi:hypothetical protein